VTENEPLLDVRGLEVTFASRKKMFREQVKVKAVDGISFQLFAGETVGLVGESGCGKSTTARGIMRLVEPSGGSVKLAGRELLGLPANKMRRARKDIQMVFQDPYSALDPSMLVRDSIAEPLDVHLNLSRSRSRGWPTCCSGSACRRTTCTAIRTSSPVGSGSG
jgi:ABC-type glutathione transport system ATPase component